jgi:hypothetical protein
MPSHLKIVIALEAKHKELVERNLPERFAGPDSVLYLIVVAL